MTEAATRENAPPVPHALASWHAALHVDGHARFEPPAYWRASWRDPGAFRRALFAAFAAEGPVRAESRLGERHDLVHDALLRHAASGRSALVWTDALGRTTEHSYAQLVERAEALAARWAPLGAAPEMPVCLLGEPAPWWWAALAAALRLGLRVTVLPPFGPSALERRLAQLDPKGILAPANLAPWLGRWAERLWPADEADAGGERAPERHRWSPGEPLLAPFAPWSAPFASLAPPVPAERAVLGALTLARVGLGLGAGRRIAAPGFSVLAWQPVLALGVWLSGACWVGWDAALLEREPERLAQAKLHRLGITARWRDRIARAGLRLEAACEGWFRPALEGLDVAVWQAFAERSGLAERPSASVWVDPARGAPVLLSPWRTRYLDLGMLPAPGERWAVVSPGGEPQAGSTAAGALVPLDEAEGEGESEAAAPWGGCVVLRTPGAWYLVGPSRPHRRGAPFPWDELLEALGPACGRSALSYAALPTADPGCPWRFVLLVFVAPDCRDPAALERRLLERARSELARAWLPDEVACFRLAPRRRADGTVDHRWCADQYVSGGLRRKAREEAFGLVSALRWALEPSGAEEGKDHA